MLRNIYIVCLTVGGLYALLSVVFGNLLDLDFDFDFDFDFDLDFDLGAFLLPIKPFTIMVFLAVFGGTGLIAQYYLSPAMSLIPAIPAGLLVSGGLYHLIYVKLRKYETRADSEADAIMQRAEVVERIMPGGYGKISYVINGNTISGAAKEKKPGGGIAKGRKVYIVDTHDNVYYVCEDLELYLKDQYGA